MLFFSSFPRYKIYLIYMSFHIDQIIQVLGDTKHTEPARECVPLNDKSTLMISIFLCVGLVISYLPQVAMISVSTNNGSILNWITAL